METVTSPTPRISGAETSMRGITDRFGGADVVAAVFGMLAALGSLVFLGALIVAGAGGIEYQLNLIDIDGNLQELQLAGSIVAVVVLFLSFLAGGWATGRMARYDGGANGLGAGLLFVLLVAVFGALGTWAGTEYNAFANAGLPDWFSQFDAQDVTAQAIALGVAGIVAVLTGGYVGGRIGQAYHQQADAALVQQARSTTL
jgi:hypothetical protein